MGLAIAKGLGQAGARVVINGRSSREKLQSAVDALKDAGVDAHGFLCDVTDEQQVAGLIHDIEQGVGPLDILVNNAGVNLRAPLEEMPLEMFDNNLRINLRGPFIVSKAAVRHMIERQRGKIINICSMMSELGRNTTGGYAASKGGLKMLTRSMATEWARHNIQINGIGPGYFATEMTAPLRQPGNPLNEFIISRTPAGRWGNPDELVGAAIFLASQASNFVNGQIVYVDGGMLATIGKPAGE